MRATERCTGPPSVAARGGATPKGGVQEAEKALEKPLDTPTAESLFGDVPDLNIDKALKIAKNRIEWKKP